MVDCIPVDLLRQKLGELEQHKKLNIDEIKNLCPEFPHSIEEADISADELGRHLQSNCAMYAFDLRRSALFSAISDNEKIRRRHLSRSKERRHQIIADTEFVEYCICEDLISQISNRNAKFGTLVVYSDITKCQHVGKLVEHGRIRSKWGTWPEILEHGLSEVPDFFGNDIRYFESVRHEQSRDFFAAYARSVVEDNPETKSILDSITNNYS